MRVRSGAHLYPHYRHPQSKQSGEPLLFDADKPAIIKGIPEKGTHSYVVLFDVSGSMRRRVRLVAVAAGLAFSDRMEREPPLTTAD